MKVNKVRLVEDLQIGKPPQFEVIIKKEGEVVYQDLSYAGVICTVEKVSEIAENFDTTGTTQKLMWGKPFLWFFAYDQLGQNVRANMKKVTDTIKKYARPSN